MKPVYIKGEVVKGFQRGSKLLGYPTANLNADNFEKEISHLETGVYFGWASVHNQIYKTVLSIGYNPHFDNTIKTIEPYLLHKFENDFYGEELKLIILGFIRKDKKFSSLEDLITEIGKDVEYGSKILDEKVFNEYKTDKFFF